MSGLEMWCKIEFWRKSAKKNWQMFLLIIISTDVRQLFAVRNVVPSRHSHVGLRSLALGPCLLSAQHQQVGHCVEYLDI